MSKKQKIPLTRTDDLMAVDADLDSAMETLDSTNQRIGKLLAGIEAAPESAFEELEESPPAPGPTAGENEAGEPEDGNATE